MSGNTHGIDINQNIEVAITALLKTRETLNISEVIDPLMTVPDVARYFQSTRQTVYNLASSGSLPSVKVGGALRFRKSDVLNFSGK